MERITLRYNDTLKALDGRQEHDFHTYKEEVARLIYGKLKGYWH